MCKLNSAFACRLISTGIAMFAVLVLNSTFVQAGPCSEEIARFEAAVRQSANNPYAGLMAPQSIGAQLDRQPTLAFVKRAEARLKSKFNRTGCSRALSEAKRMYIL